jgi:hypothetical protein
MRKYHHLGIPTKEKRRDEKHIPHLKVFVSGYDSSPYKIEWMRFEDDCAVPDIVKNIPHVAFEVDNLERELEGKQILIAPNNPSPGVKVAFIIDNGAPVEFLEIDHTIFKE